MNNLSASELILNEDRSIYHLSLHPEQLAETVLLVGDPNRVEKITRYFEEIELEVWKREFRTQTGTFNGKRISVVSTGIGTDNIDIVLNELDALVNIDFEKREVKKKTFSLDIVRIGTSGSIQTDIPVDSILVSTMAVGFDSLLHFYQSRHIQMQDFNAAVASHLDSHPDNSKPYVISSDPELAKRFLSPEVTEGFTGTNVGFYGPQGRVLRLSLRNEDFSEKLRSFCFKNRKITNLEMETSGILGLGKLLGHRALSLNAIIANRATGEFSRHADETIDRTIRYTLEKLTSA